MKPQYLDLENRPKKWDGEKRPMIVKYTYRSTIGRCTKKNCSH